MLCTFTNNAHGITQRHTLYYEAVDNSLFYYLVIHRTILGTVAVNTYFGGAAKGDFYSDYCLELT